MSALFQKNAHTYQIMNQKTNQKHGVGRIIALVALGIVLGVTIYFLIATSLGGNQMPMPFGFGVGVVSSGSMEPELSIDDLILVKAEKTYAVGDTVVYQSGRILVVHKIISIDEEEELVITRGTANSAEDAPIRLRDIKGKVVGSLPKVGIVIFMLKSTIGQILILALCGVLLWYSYTSERRREEKEHGEALDEIRNEIERLKAGSGDAAEKDVSQKDET